LILAKPIKQEELEKALSRYKKKDRDNNYKIVSKLLTKPVVEKRS
jgi:hypothetical protein